jgi:hypothetical protein
LAHRKSTYPPGTSIPRLSIQCTRLAEVAVAQDRWDSGEPVQQLSARVPGQGRPRFGVDRGPVQVGGLYSLSELMPAQPRCGGRRKRALPTAEVPRRVSTTLPTTGTAGPATLVSTSAGVMFAPCTAARRRSPNVSRGGRGGGRRGRRSGAAGGSARRTTRALPTYRPARSVVRPPAVRAGRPPSRRWSRG